MSKTAGQNLYDKGLHVMRLVLLHGLFPWSIFLMKKYISDLLLRTIGVAAVYYPKNYRESPGHSIILIDHT